MPDPLTTVLVVEDDPNIVDLVRSNLAVRGFGVVVSRTGSDVLRLFEEHRPDIVLLDLTLPGVDGFELCRRLRERSGLGIIVVSARGAETDKVRALHLGADDYLTKPFGIEELLARIVATLRRSRPATTEPDRESGVVGLGRVAVDLDARLVTRDGDAVRLTPTEFAVFRELVAQRGRLVTHAELLRRVWGPAYAANTEYVRVYIGRLRAKLEEPGDPPIILTEPRAGYRVPAPR